MVFDAELSFLSVLITHISKILITFARIFDKYENEMRKLIILFVTVILTIATNAANINPEPATIVQKDGSILTVIGHGDEHFHWFTTTDGVLLCRVGTDFFIAETTDNDLIPTKQLAHEKD